MSHLIIDIKMIYSLLGHSVFCIIMRISQKEKKMNMYFFQTALKPQLPGTAGVLLYSDSYHISGRKRTTVFEQMHTETHIKRDCSVWIFLHVPNPAACNSSRGKSHCQCNSHLRKDFVRVLFARHIFSKQMPTIPFLHCRVIVLQWKAFNYKSDWIAQPP